MVSVVTISRQYGCGGSLFAQELSKRSGFELVWREVINRAAIQIGAPDIALAMIDELGLLGLCPDEKTCEAYIKSVDKVMHDYATSGKIIIVGRAGQVILRGLDKVLHLRIIASDETRIANLFERKGINTISAKAQIGKSDSYRKEYLQKFYNIDWNDPTLYDLTINLDRLTIAQALDIVAPLLNSQE